MAITTFDTYKFIRRLEQAGMPVEQAEAQAEVLTEAFTVNLEALVTKEFLDARLDTRFAKQKAYMETHFAQIDSKFRFHSWTQAIIIAAVVMPYLDRLAGL